MRCFFLFLLTLVQALGSPDAEREPTTLTEAEKEAGWVLLFDGLSCEGWRGYQRDAFPERGWTIDAGCLAVVAGGGGGDIVTTDQYGDFELHLEWKVSRGANSGIIYCVSEDEKASWQTGPEYQILDDLGHGIDPQAHNSAGALYALYQPSRLKPSRAAGSWNKTRIVQHGRIVKHWLNGVKLLEADMNGPGWQERVARSKFAAYGRFGRNRRGHIALQDHGNEVWFRNIKIRELRPPRHPARVEQALRLAGGNRRELEAVLDHYARGSQESDALKLQAARFLIANMEGHGFTLAAFYDAKGTEIAFNALDYKNFAEARAAMDALEAQHGKLRYKRKRFDTDLTTISAAYLIENIDVAFRAWREKPWAQDVSYQTFCRFILPYRGSNEPLHSWRPECLARYPDLAPSMNDSSDAFEAARKIQHNVHRWVRFDSLFYLHPTDQGFDEMKQRKKGRCEDISNMMSYALRANAIPAATDYTPYWADRDNNHAWEVILDGEGRGRAGLSNRAAKIYRKSFAIQEANLGCRKRGEEKVPRWLGGKSYIDVTSQYMDTADVTLRLSMPVPAPPQNRFAYLCVFNAGEWQAIHWGAVDGNRVTFSAMGRNIAYLPAYFVDGKLVPAGPPVILTKAGEVRTLKASAQNADQIALTLTVTTPTTPDADTRRDRPLVEVQPGKTYELFLWRDGWQSLGKQTAGKEPVSFTEAPADGLFWLVAMGSRRLERIFTVDQGRQIWW